MGIKNSFKAALLRHVWAKSNTKNEGGRWYWTCSDTLKVSSINPCLTFRPLCQVQIVSLKKKGNKRVRRGDARVVRLFSACPNSIFMRAVIYNDIFDTTPVLLLTWSWSIPWDNHYTLMGWLEPELLFNSNGHLNCCIAGWTWEREWEWFFKKIMGVGKQWGSVFYVLDLHYHHSLLLMYPCFVHVASLMNIKSAW